MHDQNFEQLISRLEKTAQDNPQSYLFSVLGVALLGFMILGLVIGLSLLSVGLIIGLVALVVFSGGKALIFIAKLGKLIILLAIPAWTMAKASFTLLFSRFPRPTGRELRPDEAPELFTRLEDMRERMKGPRVHKVLLTDELNASIVQHPRFGLLGWEESYLILGFPLLQTLSEDETFAVVAHEYGHLSGHHSRMGGFIYRFRLAWGRLQEMSEQWNDWGSKLIARLFKWYAPYFNAYTFVLARQNEYMADQSSVELAGQQNAANALMRINIASRFEDEAFWPAINRRVTNEQEPCANRSALWAESLNTKLDAGMRSRFLEAASQRKTDHFDTHPALTDRLAAMGVDIGNAASDLGLPYTSAASVWLGANLQRVEQEFDQKWQEQVADNWRSRHNYQRERMQRLAVLQAQASLNQEEQWEQIAIIDELIPETDLLPLLNVLLQQIPEHASALFRRGSLLLERGDEAGVADIEKVMQADEGSILAGCEELWRFYKTRSPEKAEHYSKRWHERSEFLDEIKSELSGLPVDANLEAADLDDKAQESIRNIIRQHGKHIRTAYLMGRVLKKDGKVHDYVLAFETGRFTLGDKAPGIIKKMIQHEFPERTFIVHLGSEPYKRFRKSIKKLNLSPFQF